MNFVGLYSKTPLGLRGSSLAGMSLPHKNMQYVRQSDQSVPSDFIGLLSFNEAYHKGDQYESDGSYEW